VKEPLESRLHRALAGGDAALAERFRAGEGVVDLVRERARLVDSLITNAWCHTCRDPDDMALVAVGGYGRGELHPCSDVDILVVATAAARKRHREALQQFLALLWDIGLHIGHSVRTVADCERSAVADITVATNLMESRLLRGAPTLYQSMRAAIAPERLWPSERFFKAKWREQRERHAKYDDTA
jgi:[protein-PII] uridylyltransferase